MAATIAPPEGPHGAERASRLVRFSAVSRVVHWTTATLLLVLIGTAAALYLPSVATLVGRRETVKTIHVWSGFLVFVPLLAGLPASRRAPSLGRDLVRLGRWDSTDTRWLRSLGRDRSALPGKFNAGQKLFAAGIGAALTSMLATGSIMRWFSPFPLEWRTGATFVHDWLGLAMAVAVAGHVVKALLDPAALWSMVVGWVPSEWARRHRPRWYQEVAAGPSHSVLSSRDPSYSGEVTTEPRRNGGRAVVALGVGLLGLAVAGAVLVVRESGDSGADDSPGAVAVAWEERVDRADYAGLYDLAAASYRAGLSPDDFEAEAARTLLDIADVKGAVRRVSVTGETVDGEAAEVMLSLFFEEGVEVPQKVGLRREAGAWRVADYYSISQSDVIGACLRLRVKPNCL